MTDGQHLPSITAYEAEGRDPVVASSDDLADLIAERAMALGLDGEWIDGVYDDAGRRLRVLRTSRPSDQREASVTRFTVQHSPNQKHIGPWAIVDTASPPTGYPRVVGRAMSRDDAEARAAARNVAWEARPLEVGPAA